MEGQPERKGVENCPVVTCLSIHGNEKTCQILASGLGSGSMCNGTMNVSLSGEMLEIIETEVKSGHYMSGSEVVREALRFWINRRIEADLAALAKAHAGAYERDVTPEEMADILAAKREARAELVAERTAKQNAA